MEHLHRDMRLWLVGGAGQVQLVLLPKWTKHAGGQVSGVIESWGLNQMGIETLLQSAVSFFRTQSLRIYGVRMVCLLIMC